MNRRDGSNSIPPHMSHNENRPTTSVMHSRQSWPRGLHLIFWLTVLGLVVGLFQIIYWAFIAEEFFPHLTMQGCYALLALLFSVTCVALGGFGHRRAFSVTSLATAAFHVVVTTWFNLDIFRLWLPDIIAGRWNPLLSWDSNSWIYVWNSVVIGTNVLICYYLLRYEFKFFGFRVI